MSKKQMKALVIFMTLLGLVFVIGIFKFIFSPTLKEVNNLTQKITDAQTELEAQYNNRINLVSNIEKVKEIRETSSGLINQFIKPGQELVFITQIEDIATKNNVEASITLSPVINKKGKKGEFNELFSIRLEGNFNDVQKSLVELERLPNIIIVDSVAINSNELVEDEPSSISMSIRGRISFSKESL